MATVIAQGRDRTILANLDDETIQAIVDAVRLGGYIRIGSLANIEQAAQSTGVGKENLTAIVGLGNGLTRVRKSVDRAAVQVDRSREIVSTLLETLVLNDIAQSAAKQLSASQIAPPAFDMKSAEAISRNLKEFADNYEPSSSSDESGQGGDVEKRKGKGKGSSKVKKPKTTSPKTKPTTGTPGSTGGTAPKGKFTPTELGGGLLRRAGLVGVGYDIADRAMSGQDLINIGMGVGGGLAFAAAGAELGATIGAIGGPLGALAGGVIGGIGGYALGSFAGDSAYEYLSDTEAQARQLEDRAKTTQSQTQQAAQVAQMRAVQPQTPVSSQKPKGFFESAWSSIKSTFGFGDAAPAQQAPTVMPTSPLSTGRSYGKDDLKITPERQRYIDLITKISTAQGVDPSYLIATAKAESSLTPDVQAGSTSATGLFQFTESTWFGVVAKYGAQFGFSEQAVRLAKNRVDKKARGPYSAAERALLDLRKDPQASTSLVTAFTKENVASLTKKLGRAPNPGETYMAAFLGAAGAGTFMKGLYSNPNAPAYSYVSRDAARKNMSIFFFGGNPARPRTAQQVFDYMTGKIYRFGGDDRKPVLLNGEKTTPTPTAVPPKTGGPIQPPPKPLVLIPPRQQQTHTTLPPSPSYVPRMSPQPGSPSPPKKTAGLDFPTYYGV